MSAAKKHTANAAKRSPALSIFAPESLTRTTNPGLETRSPTLTEWEETTLATASAKVVPPSERERYARETTLPQFYEDCMGPRARWDRIGRKSRKHSTSEKDVTALRHWSRATRPSDWPDDAEWLGPSLDFISRASGDWLQETLESFATICGLRATSINGLGNSLRTILNHAVKVGAVSRVPKMPRVKEGRSMAHIYTPEQIESVASALMSSEYDRSIATAFLLACRIGARAGDLFGLTKEDFTKDVRGRIALRLHAQKTSEYEHKEQSIPISETTWLMVNRNCPATGPLFPLLTKFDRDGCASERSRSAHRRTERLKKVLRDLGVTFRCPWHACRATCNETLESLSSGVGQFVLGHAASGVNARSYRHPTEIVFQKINAVTPLRCELLLAGKLLGAGDVAISDCDGVS